MTFDANASGYFYLHTADMAAPLVTGYRYVSSKRVGEMWHHAYRPGVEPRK